MSSNDCREFDLVIFGASGLTGRYVVEELSRCVVESSDIKWAVAGRNAERLKETLDIVQGYLSDDIEIKGTPCILADTEDPTSIHQMCKRTKLLLNCVGPYNLFGGEMIVSSCIECKTHYIDISAEIKYLDSVLANCFEHARENGVYVIEACGFGSLPVDYGIALVIKKFPGGLNSVEYFIECDAGPTRRPLGNGTFLSLMHSLWDFANVPKFENQVEEKILKKIPTKSNLLIKKPFKFRDLFILYNYKENGWCIRCIGPDERNIKRSQMIRTSYLSSEEYTEVQGYIKFPSFYEALRVVFVFIFFIFMCFFSAGRTLIQKSPSFFTAGYFSKEGPSRQQLVESSTKLTIYANGWKKKITESEKQMARPDTKIKLTVTGPEPGYVLTPICMIQAAFTVLQDSDRMPFKGGVYPPGVAFENTSLQERLEKRGVTFAFEEITKQ